MSRTCRRCAVRKRMDRSVTVCCRACVTCSPWTASSSARWTSSWTDAATSARRRWRSAVSTTRLSRDPPGSNSSRCALCRTWIKQFKVCSLPHLGQTVQGVLFAPPGSNSSGTALCPTWIKQFKDCSLPHLDQTVQALLFASPSAAGPSQSPDLQWEQSARQCDLYSVSVDLTSAPKDISVPGLVP